MRQLEFDQDYIHFLPFGQDLEDRNLALHIAEMSMNWGRLEYWLYLLLEAIDPARAQEWTRKFFAASHRKKREAVVRKELASLFDAYPEFFAHLDKTLDDLGSVCRQRNVLAHGLWKPMGPGRYEIRPLHFDKQSGRFGDLVEFDFRYAAKLLNSMRKVLNQLASLSLEVRAGSYLKANQERIERARLR